MEIPGLLIIILFAPRLSTSCANISYLNSLHCIYRLRFHSSLLQTEKYGMLTPNHPIMQPIEIAVHLPRAGWGWGQQCHSS